VRRCRPTLHRREHSRHRGGIREGGGPHCTDGPTLDRKGVAGRGDHPRCTDGHTLAEGSGEERAGGGERRYPSSLHRRAPSSHQENRKRRLSPLNRLRKTGSCSFLNSQEPIPTQSPPLAARKILRGRARVCWRGTRGQRHLANRICESCGRWAAHACASAGPYSGP
jgi:hypothetical protein